MIKRYKKREKYIETVKPFIGKGIIKVFIGQRRVGKSYLLFQVMDEIKKKSPKANIIYINKELHEFDDINDHKQLSAYIDTKKKKGKNYLFIDEVQDILNFEKSLRSFSAKKDFDIYITGSNAKLMSGELATYLSGRYLEIPVQGLSYTEFIDFHNLSDSDETLFKYIKYGGLPYLINLKLEDEIVYNYLYSIYNTIVLKDVVARHNIRNVDFLERLILYLSDNVGSLVSANKISDFLKSQKIKLSPNSVLNYLSNLESSFFINKCERMDIRGKKVFEINEKYYFEDLGLRHSIIGYKQVDIGKILENLVYNHLRRGGYDVKVGQMDGKEIDFVAEKGGEKIYFQVAYLMIDKKTREREFGNLLEIRDAYPKFVVSMDSFPGGDFSGVKHLGIRNFLKNEWIKKGAGA